MPPAPLKLSLDRDLPVPLGAQLRGLLEWGIACGELRAGDRLPSVRELAEEVGVAPMTVAQVYRDLKSAGLIEGRAGSGTFVAQREALAPAERGLLGLHRRIDAVIDEGLALGLRSVDLAGMIAARLSARQARGRARQVVLVGIFAAATAGYARAIAEALGPSATVEGVTLDALQRSDEVRQRAKAADLVLTMKNRRREVAALLPHQQVVAISFIPSEETRRALASFDPRARILVVSRFPDFLPVMRPGVQRFAPHVAALDATVVEAPDLAERLEAHDAVVYATGAEAVLELLRPGMTAVEYRHSPDPGDIERLVRPLLQAEAMGETRKEA